MHIITLSLLLLSPPPLSLPLLPCCAAAAAVTVTTGAAVIAVADRNTRELGMSRAYNVGLRICKLMINDQLFSSRKGTLKSSHMFCLKVTLMEDEL